jgi:hypothetical protein
MTRKQAAYLRAVKHHLTKMGKAQAFDQAMAIQHFDAWEKLGFAAEQMAAPFRVRVCTPVSVQTACRLLAA